MKKMCTVLLFSSSLLISNAVFAKIKIDVFSVPTAGEKAVSLGTITAEDTKHGLLLTPNLSRLTPPLHGFHLHQHASCTHMAKDAGSHYDPENTGKHLGPYNDRGHLGDLPALNVANNGTATLPVLATRLHEKDLSGHALMIHAGGDNYSDAPQPLGGGGDRIACGIVK